MKFAFVEPSSPGVHFFKKFPIPRRGIIEMATLLRLKHGNALETEVFIEDLVPIDINRMDFDIIGISTITPTAERAYALADQLRSIGKIVVMGGPHVTFLPDEALLHCDFVVRGEGEKTIMELVEYFMAPSMFKDAYAKLKSIDGLSFRHRGETYRNKDRELTPDLDEIPMMDITLVRGYQKIRHYPIATSRGCPFECNFCSVTAMFGRAMRFRSDDAVISELRYAYDLGYRKFFIIDDNYAANRKRTARLSRRIIEENLNISLSAQVRADVAKDPELLDLLAQSGVRTLFIGFESVSQATLDAYNKKQTVKDIESAIKEIRKRKIDIHGMFIVGANTDDAKTALEITRFARKRLQSIQIMLITPLPGTQLYKQMSNEGMILHRRWGSYDGQHVVFLPASMTPEQMQNSVIAALEKFYSWGYVLRHGIRLNLDYFFIGIFGHNAVKKVAKEIPEYLSMLKKFYL